MTDGFPSYPTPTPPARRRRSGWIVLALVVLVVTVALAGYWQQSRGAGTPLLGAPREMGATLDDSSARAPADQRVQVRVVNATTTRGLARRATLVLRDFGYDVVDFDTESRRRSTTLVQVHTGKTEVGERILRVLGTGELATTTDSLRYLDFTILVGSDWKPPTKPLRP